MVLADALLGLLAGPLLLACGYLFALTLFSRKAAPPPPLPPRLRFDVVVPAHDEEAGISGTLRSLRELDYPPSLFRVLVVADNCTDATARRARKAGATVLVRDAPG